MKKEYEESGSNNVNFNTTQIYNKELPSIRTCKFLHLAKLVHCASLIAFTDFWAKFPAILTTSFFAPMTSVNHHLSCFNYLKQFVESYCLNWTDGLLTMTTSICQLVLSYLPVYPIVLNRKVGYGTRYSVWLVNTAQDNCNQDYLHSGELLNEFRCSSSKNILTCCSKLYYTLDTRNNKLPVYTCYWCLYRWCI